MTIFELNPYISVGDIRFGDLAEAVETRFGVPTGRRRFRESQLYGYPNLGIFVIFDVQGFVREIESVTAGSITLDGVEVWGRTILDFAKQDETAVTVGSTLLLPKYGLASTGFHNSGEESVTAFRKGLWDDRISGGLPFSL